MHRICILLTIFACAVSNALAEQILVAEAQTKVISEVRVPAREVGVLNRLTVREGDLVIAGQELGNLDTELLRQQVQLSQLEQKLAEEQRLNDVDLRFNRKSLEVSEAELRRATEARQRVNNSVSETEYDQLRLQAEKAGLAVEQANNDRRLATIQSEIAKQKTAVSQARVDRCQLRTPIQGMVVELLAKPGEWLNPGTPVVRVIRMDRMHVETFVDGHLHGPELQNCVATFHTKDSDNRESIFHGKVFFVSPEVHPVTGKISVIAELENPGHRLRPGIRGTLKVRNQTVSANHVSLTIE